MHVCSIYCINQLPVLVEDLAVPMCIPLKHIHYRHLTEIVVDYQDDNLQLWLDVHAIDLDGSFVGEFDVRELNLDFVVDLIDYRHAMHLYSDMEVFVNSIDCSSYAAAVAAQIVNILMRMVNLD